MSYVDAQTWELSLELGVRVGAAYCFAHFCQN